jgi:hypothetical protein
MWGSSSSSFSAPEWWTWVPFRPLTMIPIVQCIPSCAVSSPPKLLLETSGSTSYSPCAHYVPEHLLNCDTIILSLILKIKRPRLSSSQYLLGCTKLPTWAKWAGVVLSCEESWGDGYWLCNCVVWLACRLMACLSMTLY